MNVTPSYSCERCARTFPENELKSIKNLGYTAYMCPQCGGPVSINTPPSPEPQKSAKEIPLHGDDAVEQGVKNFLLKMTGDVSFQRKISVFLAVFCVVMIILATPNSGDQSSALFYLLFVLAPALVCIWFSEEIASHLIPIEKWAGQIAAGIRVIGWLLMLLQCCQYGQIFFKTVRHQFGNWGILGIFAVIFIFLCWAFHFSHPKHNKDKPKPSSEEQQGKQSAGGTPRVLKQLGYLLAGAVLVAGGYRVYLSTQKPVASQTETISKISLTLEITIDQSLEKPTVLMNDEILEEQSQVYLHRIPIRIDKIKHSELILTIGDETSYYEITQPNTILNISTTFEPVPEGKLTCFKCGHKNTSTDYYCTECGTLLCLKTLDEDKAWAQKNKRKYQDRTKKSAPRRVSSSSKSQSSKTADTSYEDGLIEAYRREKDRRGGGVALFMKGNENFTFTYRRRAYTASEVEAIIRKKKSQ